MTLDKETYVPTLVQLHPYGMECLFIWSPEEQEAFAYWCSKHSSETIQEWGKFVGKTEWECRGMTWAGGMDVPSVIGVNLPLFIKHKIPIEEMLGTLSHEIFHIIMCLSKNIYQYPSYDNDEPMAYMTGYLMKHGIELMPAKFQTVKQVVKAATK